MDDEEWVEIRGWPNYLISNWGRVYSVGSDTILVPRPSGWGYLQVCLSSRGERQMMYIHKLVGQHFVPGEDVGLEVNHKDGDKLYNDEANLEWVTKSMNNQHAIDAGLRKSRGVQIRIKGTDKVFDSLTACANYVGMTSQGVKYAARYQTKARGGYEFEYVD